MNKRYNKFIILILGFILSVPSYGQDNPPENNFEADSLEGLQLQSGLDSIQKDIHLIGMSTGQSILLRWGPTNSELWLYGNMSGYMLERAKLLKSDTVQNPVFEPIQAGGFKPWTLEEFRDRTTENDTYLMVAGQTVHGQQITDPEVDGIVASSEELENKYSFALFAADMSSDAAESLGLFYEESECDTNYLYIYKLYLIQHPDTIQDTTYLHIWPEYIPKIDPPQIADVNENEFSITLDWDRNLSEQFSAFIIERSDDGGNTFTPTSEQPFVDYKTPLNENIPVIKYQDSIELNYFEYQYRISGITPFGELIGPSEVVKAMGRDLSPPTAPFLVRANQMDDGLVQIAWEWVDTLGYEDLAGFYVYHSNNYENGYQKMQEIPIDPGAKSFIDPNPVEVAENYYFVSSVDTAGNEAYSLVTHGLMIDSIAPGIPIGLEADIDTNGYVYLSWDMGAEQDLVGYEVYFANADDHVFSEISNGLLRDTLFLDTISLKTLTEEVFYRVKAIDINFNASDMSEILAVKRPDMIPPAAAVFNDYRVSEQGILLKWAPSPSEDISAVRLVRAAKGLEAQAILTSQNDTRSYFDTDVEPGKDYVYSLEVEDDVGFVTVSPANLTLKASGPFFLPGPENFTVDKSRDMITISWDYPITDGIGFVLYRALEDGPMKSLKYLGADARTFEDRSGQKRNRYSYMMKVVHENGKESDFTEPVEVRF
jgi:hypothetical protein